MRTSARIITIDNNNNTVAVLPYSAGISTSTPVAPIVLPLSIFNRRLKEGYSIVFEFVNGRYSILDVNETT